MKLTLRDLFWLITVIAFAVALAIQTRRYQEANQEAKNRTLECEYYVKEMLQQDKELEEWRRLYGSPVPPKFNTVRPTRCTK